MMVCQNRQMLFHDLRPKTIKKKRSKTKNLLSGLAKKIRN